MMNHFGYLNTDSNIRSIVYLLIQNINIIYLVFIRVFIRVLCSFIRNTNHIKKQLLSVFINIQSIIL